MFVTGKVVDRDRIDKVDIAWPVSTMANGGEGVWAEEGRKIRCRLVCQAALSAGLTFENRS